MATARAFTYSTYSGENIYGGITPKVAHVFMETGQSNCQGLGALADSPIADNTLIGNVKTWRRNIDGTIYSGDGQWYGLEYGTNQYEGRNQFGSILKFAMNAQVELEDVNNDLFFIKADGNGKPIEGWLDGGSEHNAMYNGHIRPALISLQAMDYDEIRIHNFVWNQGESDMLDPAKAAVYKTRLETVIADLKAELNLPNLLFIIKRVEATPARYTEASTVVAAQESIAQENNNVELVTGPWVYSDEVHLVGNSLNQLGDDLYSTTRANTRGLIYA